MKRYLGQILTSMLLGISILLGLSFWLNIKFGFNIFYAEHWDELARLQASHTPINQTFYISIGIAIFLFIFGLYIIFRPRFRNIFKHSHTTNTYQPIQIQSQNVEQNVQIPHQTATPLQQPPKLHLPKNMAEIAVQRYTNPSLQSNLQTKNEQPTLYDSQLSEIFKNAGYVVKPNLTIAGFTTNLFAIGTNEVVWFGAVDCDMNKFKTSVNKLKSVFKETLEDIPITVSAFVLNTKGLINSDDETLIFNSTDELRAFLDNNPNPPIPDSEQDNFNAYSDYIDTIIQYAKNI